MGHIVLVGLMGSGKTMVGAPLAAALNVAHRDSDRDLHRDTGLTARELAARDGIDALHALEARHLRAALADPGTSVIGAAASTLDDPVCRTALKSPDHLVVWLRADPAVIAGRLQHGDHRPGFGPDLTDVIRAQARRRTIALDAVADLTVDATEPPDVLVEAIRTHADAVR